MLRPPGERRSSLAAWLLEASAADQVEVLKSHGVDEVARAALQRGDGVGFIQPRQRLLVTAERAFLATLGIEQAVDDARLAPVDTD